MLGSRRVLAVLAVSAAGLATASAPAGAVALLHGRPTALHPGTSNTGRATLNANLVPSSGVLWGAFVSGDGAPTHMAAVQSLESQLGFKISIDQHYRPWTNKFWRDEQQDIAAGRVPMISWTARGTTAVDIASGSQDANIVRVAQAVKALGAPVFLRFAYEMDQPQGSPRYLGSPADFVAAWRHVYTIFQQQGATNARFVWCPIAYNFVNGTAPQFYPGDAYVDWIASDGYNWYPGRSGGKWKSFGDIFSAFYAWAAPHGKPLMIAETGAQEDPADPGRKAQWLADAAAWLQLHPAIRAVSYFDSVSPAGYDFTAGSSQPAFAAFRAWGATAYFNTLQ
jgi:hypothetical protein